MSLRKLPAAKAFARPDCLNWDPPSDALGRWAERPFAAEADNPDTISIYDVIGEDWWTGEGVTAKRIAAALRSIGPKPVTVSINSPGGDMFEGLAIYNLLREHPAQVKVRVMGLAASAASVVAMAGDEIAMGLGSFLMIHNAWGVVVGNRNDFTEAAKTFAQFDEAMAEIYAARTGHARPEVEAMMDAETWLGASEAIAAGFADEMFESMREDGAKASVRADIAAKRRIEAILAKEGMPRSDRRRLLRDAAGTRDAAGNSAMPGAGIETAALKGLLATLTSARSN